jgi:hypothetical protein
MESSRGRENVNAVFLFVLIGTVSLHSTYSNNRSMKRQKGQGSSEAYNF